LGWRWIKLCVGVQGAGCRVLRELRVRGTGYRVYGGDSYPLVPCTQHPAPGTLFQLPGFCSIAARTRPRCSLEGLLGRDLSSGWNWLPMK